MLHLFAYSGFAMRSSREGSAAAGPRSIHERSATGQADTAAAASAGRRVASSEKQQQLGCRSCLEDVPSAACNRR